MIPYRLVRSRRKTLAIHITKDAAVEVRAPLKMSESYIDGFVKKKEKWIEDHVARRRQVNEEKKAFSINYGDNVLLYGKPYPLRAWEKNSVGFDGECLWAPGSLTTGEIKGALEQIYRAAAKRLMKNRVGEYAGLMGVKPASVRITGAKTRWGSCSGKNNISFSWRLMMAEMDVIDYVAVHELAHLKELNHSPRFWAVVEEVMPDYPDRKRKLKQLQDRLSTQDWD